MQKTFKSLWPSTIIEWLIIIAIIAVTIAILVPEAQWASDGDITIPVRVVVFDAETVTPINGAQVSLFRCPPWTEDEFLKGFRERWSSEQFDADWNLHRGVTDVTGQAVITYKFNTSASNKNPVTRAHTRWVWTAVRANGYGGAAVQLRQESLPTSILREQKGLTVPVGLIKATGIGETDK